MNGTLKNESVLKNLLIIITITLLSCKNDSKYKRFIQDFKKNEIVENKLNEVILPNYSLWNLNRIKLSEAKSDLFYKNNKVFLLSRTSTNKTSYASVNNVSINYGSIYKSSIVVKESVLGNLFALRLTGEYPNRIDAVYDLKNGVLEDVKNVGSFIDGKAEIENLGDGWYKCSIQGLINADRIKIILGPTLSSNNVLAWEAKTEEKCSIYIVPTSLSLEELIK